MTARSWSSSDPVMLGWRRREITNLKMYTSDCCFTSWRTYSDKSHHVFDKSVHFRTFQGSSLTLNRNNRFLRYQKIDFFFQKIVRDGCKKIGLFYLYTDIWWEQMWQIQPRSHETFPECLRSLRGQQWVFYSTWERRWVFYMWSCTRDDTNCHRVTLQHHGLFYLIKLPGKLIGNTVAKLSPLSGNPVNMGVSKTQALLN